MQYTATENNRIDGIKTFLTPYLFNRTPTNNVAKIVDNVAILNAREVSVRVQPKSNSIAPTKAPKEHNWK